MPSATSSIPIASSAFITEADAQAFCLRGSEASAAQADQIMRGINWGAARMELYTGRRLKDQAYTRVKTLNVDSRSGELAPRDGAAAAALAAALVGEPVLSSHLKAQTYISAAWDGSTVAITPADGTGSATDTVKVGSRPILLDGANTYKQLNLPEWPLTQLSTIALVYPDGTRTLIDWASDSIIDYDEAGISLGSGYFIHWDYEVRRCRIEVEARCGYVQPSTADRGHPVEWEQLAEVNRELCMLHFQKYQTPGQGFMDTAGAGQVSGSFSRSSLPDSVQSQLNPFKRRAR